MKFTHIIKILLVGVAIFSSYQMYKNSLWEHETLLLFSSLWLLSLGVFERKWSRMPTPKRYMSWAMLSGVLLWLGFPSVGWSPVLLVALVPLLMVEHDISRYYGGIKKRAVFKHTFITMMTWNILSVYWVGNASLFAGFFAITANSALMTLPIILGHVTRHKMPKLGYAAMLGYWLTFEYLHFRWDLAFPWLTLGNGFATFHQCIQWYEFTGVLGGTAWIWVCNLLFFSCWKKYLNKEKTIIAGLLFALLVAIPISISLYQYYSFSFSDEKIDVVCMQPNYEPHYEKGTVSNIEILEKSMKQGEKLIDNQTQYVLFPEATFDGIKANRLEQNNEIIRTFQMITNMEYPNLKIIAGVSGYKTLSPEEAQAPSTRLEIVRGDSIYYHVFNSAIQIGEQRIQTYKKSKLVIGPEFLPFSRYLRFLKPLTDKMGGSLEGFSTEKERKVFTSKTAKVAPVICYEQNFGGFMRGYIKHGAEFIAIITNDAWWGRTDGYRQHLAFARLRAIEFRRGIARAANTGSSCFINARGDMSQATKYGVTDAIKGQVELRTDITQYAIMGDMIGRLAMFMSLLVVLNMLVKDRLSKRTQDR